MSAPRLVAYPLEVLEAQLRTWQRQCRLQDWRIELAIVRERDFQNKSKLGETTTFVTLCVARITLLDPVDVDTRADWAPYDMWETLAHELAHLVVWPWEPPKRETVEYDLYEQSVERIACWVTSLAPRPPPSSVRG